MTQGIGSDNLVNIAARVREKEQAAVTKSDGPKTQNYKFIMMDGTALDAFGLLMINTAFVATGVPTADGSGVNFTFAAPLGHIKYVQSIPETKMAMN